jgi:hypothetical protein
VHCSENVVGRSFSACPFGFSPYRNGKAPLGSESGHAVGAIHGVDVGGAVQEPPGLSTPEY